MSFRRSTERDQQNSQMGQPPVRRRSLGDKLPIGLPFGLRGAVLLALAVIISSGALLISRSVSSRLEQDTTAQAELLARSLVSAEITPLIPAGGVSAMTGAGRHELDVALAGLTSSGDILRIKIWAPDGTIVASDEPALVGTHFPIEDNLRAALGGASTSEIAAATDADNKHEQGLADRFLSVYLPLQPAGATAPIGAYEIYQDGAPLEASLAGAQRDLLLIIGALAAITLGLLWLAFSGASRRLSSQNRSLREQAVTASLLSTDILHSAQRFRSLVENSSDVIVAVTADGTMTYVSDAVERVIGHKSDHRTDHSVFELIHPDDVAAVRRLMVDILTTPGAGSSHECRVRHADGSWRFIEASFRNLLDDPAVNAIVVNYRDITASRALEEEMSRRAFHDALTGLPNRTLFTDRLDHALVRGGRSAATLAVMFIDLDDFKTINDSMGHGEGDRLLVSAATRLQAGLRPGDTIARMGGDEFAVLLEDQSDQASAMIAATRLQTALDAPFVQAGQEFFVRASIGVALSGPGANTEDLLRDADIAMYIAKGKGKNQVELFAPGMETTASARLSLRSDLEHALGRNEFEQLYQPMVDLETGQIYGVEALIRWHHPARGLVGPVEFIPLAEETGLIIPIAQWCLQEACRQLKTWDAAGLRPLTMNVNVSGRQVARGDELVADVRAALAHFELEPARLTLELTESMLMQDTAATAATVAQLKALGVKLALDDFGTGYSSLSYLRRFAFDSLKIDRSFISALGASPDQTALVSSIIKLAQTMNLKTVAEGIEEPSQLAELQGFGADSGQGWLFAKAMKPEAVMALVESGPMLDAQRPRLRGVASDAQQRPQVQPVQV